MPNIASYKKQGVTPIQGLYTGREFNATKANRCNKSVRLQAGLVLVRDAHDWESGEPNALDAAGAANTSTSTQQGSGNDWSIYDTGDTSEALMDYNQFCVVTNAGFPRLAPGTVSGTTANTAGSVANYSQAFEGVTNGEVQILIADDSDLVIGQLLYLTNATGTVNDTPITAVSSVIDTVAELYKVVTKPIAVLLEPHTYNSASAPVLRWCKLLNNF